MRPSAPPAQSGALASSRETTPGARTLICAQYTKEMKMSGVGFFGALVIGLLAGWIAEKVMARDHGLLTNLVVGLIGSYLGAFLAYAAGFTYAGFWPSLVVSALGAIVLLFLVGLIRGRSTRFQ
jgi:uncharacterized membrane protein YeaQ/YmgE (transglycosylase-associated protein family)